VWVLPVRRWGWPIPAKPPAGHLNRWSAIIARAAGFAHLKPPRPMRADGRWSA